MNEQFETVAAAIRNRRNIKPAQMNGQKIEDALVQQLLELADWAPTHGRTEPWRFVVYGPDKVKQFALDHAGMYQDHTPQERFTQLSFDNLQRAADGASHVVIAYMRRGSNPNIPEME